MWTTNYFASRYFAPHYWGHGDGNGYWPSRYFSPRFWPHRYFVHERQNGYFEATAYPTATFESVLVHGYFQATADPLASFIAGLLLFTAYPTATVTGDGTNYHSMGFTAIADPILAFTGFEPVGFIATAYPKASFFVQVGKPISCTSATGAAGGTNKPGNFSY